MKVSNGRGQEIGRFKSKLFTSAAASTSSTRRAEVRRGEGRLEGWNFKLLDANGLELGIITKKWAGLGRELFTNADQYVISMSDSRRRLLDRAAALPRGRPRRGPRVQEHQS